MIALVRGRPDLLPSLAVALAGASWGLFWLPFRAFHNSGLEGIWTSLAFFVVSLAVMLPLVLLRWKRLQAGGLAFFVTGACTGAAFALYGTSLLLTEVVRALLLFYVTPLWGTLLGVLLLHERITLGRSLALLLGAGGLVVILGNGSGLPIPRNAGDWMALLSGLLWAYGTLRVYRHGAADAVESMTTFVIGGLAMTALAALAPMDALGATPDWDRVSAVLPWLILMIVGFFLPTMFLVLWGAARLSPGRVGILLLGEVLVGVLSAAILTDEPFGLREALGGILIVAAGGIEVLQRPGLPSPASPNTGTTGESTRAP